MEIMRYFSIHHTSSAASGITSCAIFSVSSHRHTRSSGRSETPVGQGFGMMEDTTFKPIHSVKSGTRPYCRDRTEQWTLLASSGRLFEISVSLPKAPAPITGFPVLYVL